MNHNFWQSLGQTLINDLQSDEVFSLSLVAEDTLYVRLNQAKVRQSSAVKQALVEVHFLKNNRNVKLTLPLTGHFEEDFAKLQKGLQQCRLDIETVPEDPLLQMPLSLPPFYRAADNKIDRFDLLNRCLKNAQNQDFVGLFTAGEMIRANYNSVGLDQWFESSTFALDFSFYTQNQQAVKGVYGGLSWSDQTFESILHEKRLQLQYLNLPKILLNKGKYRVYLAPAAVENLTQMLSWRGISQSAYQQGQCALKKLVDGEKTLSSKFSLQENFTTGETPPFNEKGEISSEILSLIKEGQYISLLSSSRTAQEYNIPTNFAAQAENLRSPEILGGDLAHDRILKELDTGVFIPNIHYLNWSDLQEGRITGMTRFGCFWIENGKIIGPIQDMRFDESLYHFWGEGLESVTDTVYTFPNLDTYFHRNLGITKVPGMIVNGFTFVG